MTPDPKMSVLLVSYNQERFMEECLQGILIQDYPHAFEVVVADDCSSDGTLRIIEERLSAAGIAYRVLPTPENLGMFENYRRGFAACRGEYVAVLEGDDYWTYTRKLAEHTAFLDVHRECVMSFSRPIVYREQSRRFEVRKSSTDGEFDYLTTAQLAAGEGIGNLSTCVFRNSAVRKLDEAFWQIGAADWGFGLALGHFGLIARFKNPMSVYRIHAGGLWSGRKHSTRVTPRLDCIEVWDRYLGYHFSKEFNERRKREKWEQLRRGWRRRIGAGIRKLFGGKPEGR